MHIALGVHVSTYEVTASLVDTGTPELGPIGSRAVPVAAAPGGIAGAVSTALGFMRVQARQHDLSVVGAAVVCENSLQREIIADALADTEPDPVLVVDIFDARLSDAFPLDVAAAMLVGEVDAVAASPSAQTSARRAVWPVAAAAACVLAALGGVTAWAMTSSPTSGNSTVPVEMVHPTTVVPTTADSIEPAIVTSTPPVPVESSEAPVPATPDAVDAVAPAPAVVPPVVVPTQTRPPGPVATTTRTTQNPAPGGGSGTTTTTTPATTTSEPTSEPEPEPDPEPGDNQGEDDDGQ